MTDDQKRIAIAEEDGWKYITGEAPRYGGKFMHAGWKATDGKFHKSDWKKKSAVGLPPYLTSRDAIVPAILRRFRTTKDIGMFCNTLISGLVYQADGFFADCDGWHMDPRSILALATADPRVLADAFLAAAAKP